MIDTSAPSTPIPVENEEDTLHIWSSILACMQLYSDSIHISITNWVVRIEGNTSNCPSSVLFVMSIEPPNIVVSSSGTMWITIDANALQEYYMNGHTEVLVSVDLRHDSITWFRMKKIFSYVIIDSIDGPICDMFPIIDERSTTIELPTSNNIQLCAERECINQTTEYTLGDILHIKVLPKNHVLGTIHKVTINDINVPIITNEVNEDGSLYATIRLESICETCFVNVTVSVMSSIHEGNEILPRISSLKKFSVSNISLQDDCDDCDDSDDSDESNGRLSDGAIGGIVGGIVALCLIAVFVVKSSSKLRRLARGTPGTEMV